MTDEKIAELKRLWEAATPGEWASKRCGTKDEIWSDRGQIADLWLSPFGSVAVDANSDLIAALHNAFPDLIAALEAAQAERDERTTMAARAQEAMRYLLNGLPATDAIWAAYGNADSARAWLAARDARLKAEGAAEWLECHRNDDWLAVDQRERFDREAAELRREAGE